MNEVRTDFVTVSRPRGSRAVASAPMGLRARIFAATYDRMMAVVEKAGMQTRRERLLADAHGRVLEVGAGTGANLQHYGAAVEKLTMTEPEQPMLKRLRARAEGHLPRPDVVSAPAERLPFGDGEFDTVVCTLVLCTAKDQASVLHEIRRVLRPDGQLLFIEHVRAEDHRLARRQDRLNRLNRAVAHGCNCNRATVDAIRGAGFDVTKLERADLDKAPSWLRPLVVGTAIPVT